MDRVRPILWGARRAAASASLRLGRALCPVVAFLYVPHVSVRVPYVRWTLRDFVLSCVSRTWISSRSVRCVGACGAVFMYEKDDTAAKGASKNKNWAMRPHDRRGFRLFVIDGFFSFLNFSKPLSCGFFVYHYSQRHTTLSSVLALTPDRGHDASNDASRDQTKKNISPFTRAYAPPFRFDAAYKLHARTVPLALGDGIAHLLPDPSCYTQHMPYSPLRFTRKLIPHVRRLIAAGPVHS